MKGKQRSYLKGLAQQIQPTVYIGKAGLTEALVQSVDDALSARELVKCQIQDGAGLAPAETCDQLAHALGAEFVQAIGHRFVLYRQAKDPDHRKIQLPR